MIPYYKSLILPHLQHAFFDHIYQGGLEGPVSAIKKGGELKRSNVLREIGGRDLRHQFVIQVTVERVSQHQRCTIQQEEHDKMRTPEEEGRKSIVIEIHKQEGKEQDQYDGHNDLYAQLTRGQFQLYALGQRIRPDIRRGLFIECLPVKIQGRRVPFAVLVIFGFSTTGWEMMDILSKSILTEICPVGLGIGEVQVPDLVDYF